ncbi:MAG: UDPglucose 6-dehydrogenase, partial [Actinomycetota bacterium]|nr:UDPglucose 6-dehydrogenase [Actinomycetota bacterium]
RSQHEHMVDKVRKASSRDLGDTVVGVWGLTFKADTDDLRDSPSLVIAGHLVEAGATVRAYDPAAGEQAASRVPGIEICADPYDAAAGADVVALLTEWDQFRWLDFDRVRDVMRTPAIVDARNLLDPAAMRRRGFTYDGVGRR